MQKVQKLLLILIFILIVLIFIKAFYPNNIKGSKEKSDRLETPSGKLNNNVDDKLLDKYRQKDEEKNEYIYTYEFNDQNIVATIIKIKQIEHIILGTNLNDNESSTEIFNKLNCRLLANSGFYSEMDLHIGLYRIDGVLINPYMPNQIFNGIVNIKDNYIFIDKIDNNISNAFQSGPLVFYDGNPQKYTIKNDKHARRLVLGQGDSGNIFILVYNKNNLYSGPTLEYLPTIIDTINKQFNLKIVNAVNLDGGSASSIIANGIKFTELTSIGGYICIQ